jgi:hypothetical protein
MRLIVRQPIGCWFPRRISRILFNISVVLLSIQGWGFGDTYRCVQLGLVTLQISIHPLLITQSILFPSSSPIPTLSTSQISAAMKTQLTFLALCGALVSAAPLDTRSGVDDTASDMSNIVSKKSACAPVAVLFARGTFDSG